jgi:predicted exporter
MTVAELAAFLIVGLGAAALVIVWVEAKVPGFSGLRFAPVPEPRRRAHAENVHRP